jgi:SAM-dependent methyltransferase
MEGSYAPCDLCSGHEARLLLESQRLDGPLVQCKRCDLVYVGRRQDDFTFSDVDRGRSAALAARVAELGIVSPDVEEAERPWRIQADRERLARLRQHIPGGTLLDVGCATGTFVEVASAAFDAWGVEPDSGTSEQARAAGLSVVTGTVADVVPPAGGFDAVTMFHVIEHLDSPHGTVRQARKLLSPNGVVMIETPTVDSVWFRLARSRWRQLIPDHYFFFSHATLERLLAECGLQLVDYEKVGRRVSLRFVVDRFRRSGIPGVGGVAPALRRLGLEDIGVRLNPGDIMSVVARPVAR